MKVSLVTETYFPQINGVSRSLGKLVNHLVKMGDQVQLIVPRYAEANEDEPGVERLSFKGLSLPVYKEIQIVLASHKQIRKALTEYKPDIVHIATEGPLGRGALKVTTKIGYPLVTSFHTNFPQYLKFYGFGFLTPLSWAYLRKFHNAGNATFCPTMSIKENLEEKGFDNVRIWGRGIECNRFSPEKRSDALRQALGINNGQKLLVYIGRLANEKNLDMLLEAFELIRRNFDCRLALVGDGPAREKLEQQANDHVVFTGYKRGEELATHYASADLFVFPSLTETFGNVILEGMASGLPAVGYDAPGPRDIIKQGETGMIANEITPQAFAEAAASILSDEEKLQTMFSRARSHAESQKWHHINECVRQTYQEFVTP